MNVLQRFTDYLSSEKIKPSKVTVKNYKADVGQFITWLEDEYKKSFDPLVIDVSVIELYKKAKGATISARSLERHTSSLRKFFRFLKNEGLILRNPLDTQAIPPPKHDPWHIKDFKDHLYVYNSSILTIKNYIIDIKQFLAWAEEVLGVKNEWNIKEKNILKKIDFPLVQEYKERLQVSGFSPRTINRKLSSLRKYISWAKNEGLLKYQDSSEFTQYIPQIDINNTKEYQNESNSSPSYSWFPAIRLMQKTKRGLDSMSYNLITYLEPFFEIVKRKKIFIPVATQQGLVMPAAIPNIPKEFFAPISTKHLPLYKKTIFTLRHKRPKWYKKYHSYPIAHYIHFAILIVIMTVIGIFVARQIDQPQTPQSILGAAIAPPRNLSFQGRLTDTANVPITTEKDIKFAVYNSATSFQSSLLWQETDAVKPDNDGFFSTSLGNNTPIPESLFTQNQALWLGISIGSDPELTPRQPFATVAFATNAEFLQGLTPITQTDAGTKNVILALDSSGNLTIGQTANPTFQATGGQFTLSGKTLLLSSVTGSNGNVSISPDGSGKIDLQKAIVNSTTNGSINSGAVEVHDKFVVIATESAQAAFMVNNNTNSGDIFTASSAGTPRFVITSDGNVGIGTTTPTNALEIKGHIATTNGASYDIGASSKGFRTLYVHNAIPLSTSGIFGWLQRNSGTLAPTHIADDFLVGAISTAAAKFQIFSSSGNATSAGNLTFSTAAKIQTTNNLNLTLGGNTTGSIILSPSNNGGSVGINTSTPLAAFDVRNAFNFIPTASLSAQSSFATLIVDNTTGDLITASSSGVSQFVVKNNGSVGIGNGAIVPTAFLDVSGTASISGSLHFRNGAGSIQTTGNNTLILGGSTTGNIILSPTNNTGFVGINTSSPIAHLDVRGISGLVPTASFSANLNKAAFFIENTLGDLFTASSSGVTQFVIRNNGNVGIGNVPLPTAMLDVAGTASVSSSVTFRTGAGNIQTTAFNTITFGGSTTGDIILNPSNAGTGGLIRPQTTNVTDLGSLVLQFRNIYGQSIFSNGTQITDDWDLVSGALAPKINTADLLIGATSSTSANFHVYGSAQSGTVPSASVSANTSFAGFVADNRGSGDLFTASSAGLTRFTITSSGNVGIGPDIPNARLDVAGNATVSGNLTLYGAARSLQTTAGNTFTLGGSTTGNIILSPSNAAGFVGINTTNPLYALDVSGNTNISTGSTFKINGTDVLSATTLGTGVVTSSLTSVGTIATGVWQGTVISPTYGGSPYENLTAGTISPRNLTTDLLLGGTASASAFFHVYGIAESGTRPVASISARSAFAGLVVDNTIGDLFSASSSGVTQFVIRNNGNVGIGNVPLPTAMLDVRGSASLSGALTLTTTPTLQSTAMQTLTLGGTTTGAIALSPASATPSLFVTNGGNVGIGSTSPRVRLDVRSDAVIAAPTALSSAVSSGMFILGDTVGSVFGLQLNGSSYDTYIQARNMGASSTAYNLLLQPLGGNVGIGNSTPLTALDITGSASLSANLSLRGTATAHTFNILDNGTLNIQRSPGGDAGLTTALFVQNNGNVGIGTVTPEGKLNIVQSAASSIGLYLQQTGSVINNNDNAAFYVLDQQTNGTAFRVRNDSALAASYFAHIFLNNTSASAPALTVDNFGTGNSFVVNDVSGDTTPFVINNAGDVSVGSSLAIGTTPAASGALRLAYLASIIARNSANSADGVVIQTTDASTITVGGATFTNVVLGNNGKVFVGDTTNGNMGQGITINQQEKDDEIISLKSSDVSHAMTSLTEADSYGYIKKLSATSGGLWIEGLTDTGVSSGALYLVGANTDTADTTKSTAGLGVVRINAGVLSGTNRTTVGANGNLVSIENNGSTKFLFDAEGTGHADDVWTDNAFDLAEDYPVRDGAVLEPGDVVSLVENPGKVDKSTSPYNKELFGVVSYHTAQLSAVLSNDQPRDAYGNLIGHKPIALSGRVPVKVTTENGQIKRGDYLTSSSTPGYAMKATKPGLVIGRALEDYSGPGSSPEACGNQWQREYNPLPSDTGPCQKILAYINVSFADPTIYLTDTGDLHFTKNDNFGLVSEETSQQPETISYYLKTTSEKIIERIGVFSELVVANLRAGYVHAQALTVAGFIQAEELAVSGSIQAQKLITQTLEVTMVNAEEITTKSLIATNATLESLSTNILNTQYLLLTTDLVSPIASIDQIQTDIISPLSSDSIVVDGKLVIRDSGVTNVPQNDIVLEVQNASGAAVATIDNSGNATFAGTLSANTASISGTLRTNRLIADNIASLSGELAYIQNLSAVFGTFTQGLISLGPSSFNDVSIANQLIIGNPTGGLILADNSINVLGNTLEIQPLRQGGVNFLGGLISIDFQGNLQVKGNAEFDKNLAVNGVLSAGIISPIPNRDLVIRLSASHPELVSGSQDSDLHQNDNKSKFVIENASGSAVLSVNQSGDIISSGSGTFSKLNLSPVAPAYALSNTEQIASGSAGTTHIKAHQLELTINNTQVSEKSLIYITPIGTPSAQIPSLLRQVPNTSFTIGIASESQTDTPFNWLIVN